MFKKMQNHKGFTLIEMLVVIAIIAVLTSIIIPVVSNSTDKAAAATNAANLRSVEGELVAMMLIDPYAFGDQASEQNRIDQEQNDLNTENADLAQQQQELAELQTELSETQAELTEAQTDLTEAQTTLANYTKHDACGFKGWSYNCVTGANMVECGILKGLKAGAQIAVNTAQNVVTGLQSEVTSLQGQVAAKEQEIQGTISSNNDKLAGLEKEEESLYTFAAKDGIITLPDGETKINAPASKAVDKDGVVIDKDVQMVVTVNTITNTASAKYGNYTSGNFAVVAGDDEGVTG